MTTELVTIHVRFANDGSVTEIGERPVTISAQDWFNRLSLAAGMSYQSLSGGRGFFKLTPAEVEAFKSGTVH